MCLLIAWILASWLFYPDTLKTVAEMLWEGGYLCYFFFGLIGFLAYKMLRWKSEVADHIVRTGLFMVAVSSGMAFYCLAAVIFAYRVYPYIPVSKGGGDYSDEKPVVLTFDARFRDAIPQQLFDFQYTNQSLVVSRPVLLIEETPAMLFLASPHGNMSPLDWRKPGPQNKPTILSLKREAVTSIVVTN